MIKKIAIVLSGHLRSMEIFEKVIESFYSNVIDKNNQNFEFDFFIHTWDVFDWWLLSERNPIANLKPELSEMNNICPEAVIKMSTPHQEKPEGSFDKAIFSTYRTVFESGQLKKKFELENNITYDAVIKSRNDLLIRENIYLSDVNFDQYNFTKDKFGFCDWFCLANNNLMNHYLDVFLHLDWLYEKIKREGCFGNFIPDHHNLLLKHLLEIGHGYPIDLIKKMKIPPEPIESNADDLNYQKKQKIDINQIDFSWCFLRNDDRHIQTFYYKD